MLKNQRNRIILSYFFIFIFISEILYIFRIPTFMFLMERISDYRGWKNSADISVLMPTYNRKKFLPRSIDSILNQTYKNLEFIIVDDGSTDSSWKLLFKYLINDSRIRVYFNHQNRGRSYSRNKLIDLSKTNYLSVMDSDDYAFPEKLKKQYTYMTEHPDVDVIFAYSKVNGEISKKIYLGQTTEKMMVDLLLCTPFSHITMIVKKDFLSKNNIKYDENNSAEDYELYYQLFVKRAKFYVLPEYLVDVYKHQLNPKKYYKDRDDDFDEISKKFHSLFFGGDEDLYYASKCVKLIRIYTSNKKLKLLDGNAILEIYNEVCSKKINVMKYIAINQIKNTVTDL